MKAYIETDVRGMSDVPSVLYSGRVGLIRHFKCYKTPLHREDVECAVAWWHGPRYLRF